VLDQRGGLVALLLRRLIRSRITGTSSTDLPAVGSSNIQHVRLERHHDRDLSFALVAVRQRRGERVALAASATSSR